MLPVHHTCQQVEQQTALKHKAKPTWTRQLAATMVFKDEHLTKLTDKTAVNVLIRHLSVLNIIIVIHPSLYPSYITKPDF